MVYMNMLQMLCLLYLSKMVNSDFGQENKWSMNQFAIIESLS